VKLKIEYEASGRLAVYVKKLYFFLQHRSMEQVGQWKRCEAQRNFRVVLILIENGKAKRALFDDLIKILF